MVSGGGVRGVVLLEGARLYTEPCRAGRVVRLQTEPNGGWVVRKGE